MRSKKYILVAEDDSFYGDIYDKKLKDAGFQVEVVCDGKKALDKIKKRKPDLFLLDLIMPVLDGFSVLEELKKQDKIKDLKIIALSNLDNEEDIEKVKTYGVSEYIVKANMSIDEVLENIKKYLK